MRRVGVSVLLVLLASAAVSAAPPPIPRADHKAAPKALPERVDVPAGGYADLAFEIPPGAAVVWRFSTPPVQRSQGLPPGRLIFAGSGRVVVTAIVIDFKKQTVTDTDTVVTFGPEPPPVPPVPPTPPTPPTPPEPPPEPAPIPEPGFRVLIVYESADLTKYPRGQVNFMGSTSLEAYLQMKCAKGPDGKTPERFIADKDTPMDNAAKLWQDAMKRATSKATTYPWVIVSNGKTGYEGPLPYNPTDPTDLNPGLSLLKKYGGD